MKMRSGTKMIMNNDGEGSKLVNNFVRVLVALLFLPLLLPLIVLCTVCLCLPLLFCVVIVYCIYCEGLFASIPWLAWPISIWLIALGLFGSGKMIFDTFYKGN